MTDSTHLPGAPVAAGTSCLGRTCLKWGADGELTSQDLQLVMERLAKVDREVTALYGECHTSQPCPSIG
jgi:hypothetical protein